MSFVRATIQPHRLDRFKAKTVALTTEHVSQLQQTGAVVDGGTPLLPPYVRPCARHRQSGTWCEISWMRVSGDSVSPMDYWSKVA